MTKVQSHVMLVLPNVTIEPSNVRKNKGTTKCDVGTAQCEEKKKPTKCDKSIVKCYVSTAKYDNEIIKCEKK